MSLAWMKRRWALPLVVATGVAVAVAIIKSRPAMEHADKAQLPAAVKVVSAKRYEVRPRITGFGEVAPDVVLDSKAEVSGKVTYVHPLLKKGSILPAGTLVVSIDDRDYQLALKQAEADLAVSRANLEEMRLNIEDTEQDLKLAQEKLAIARKEQERIGRLLQKGSASQSNYDAQQSVVLQLRQETQKLSNQLQTLPYQLQVLQAKQDIAEAAVETQKRNLERTHISLPFNARITRLSVEENQFVAVGASLYGAQTIDKVLVNAQFPLSQFRLLAEGFANLEDLFQKFLEQDAASNIFTELDLAASVALAEDGDTHWDAKVERISNNLEAASRTLGVIVGVDNPYRTARPGVRPPLIEGMYAKVELQGAPQPFLVLPRDALREHELYVVDKDNRLRRIKPHYKTQGAMLLIRQDDNEGDNAIHEGERVVTTDLFPAVAGMLVTPQEDNEAEALIEQWAQGRQTL
ncbi:efflux RND transporter periplasmic adaptor subunit [Hahella sp. HN01]|uniref:efflux RND transporter periplasmic adaptor subunit n=1 Tax=Hahella sp. HN01 TaxID=2847262 RepID=UPI001C1EE0AA|nr:hypothetical protein [Hahella sp. HN01]MBU6950134.1 hypothetical protein [Hahella sp. HN01]